MEKMEQGLVTDGGKRDDEFFVIRHSLAQYQGNKAIIGSDNPEAAFDPKTQDFRSDLTPDGQELARTEAEKFFDQLDPERDAIFFASSDLVRAIETAQIYKDVAKERGFEIIVPENVRNEIVEEIGEGEIRKVEALSLNIENMLLDFVFFPEDQLEEAVKDKDFVSEDTKRRWVEARKIIESDNQGTWGRNYHKHSRAIQEIFPNIRTAENMYDKKFKGMVRLMRMAQRKINQEQPQKNIKVLAFSHENAMLHFMSQNFHDASINNCEGVAFKIDGPNIKATARGQTKDINI